MLNPPADFTLIVIGTYSKEAKTGGGLGKWIMIVRNERQQ